MAKSYFNRLHLQGGLSFANYTLLNGPFLVGFALALGANNFEIGVITAIPLFTNLIQLVSAFILDITGTRKWTTIFSLGIGRLIWVLMILMAFGLISPNINVFILLLLLSSLLQSVGYLSILSWIKTIVPFRFLANFFGKRNIYSRAGGIIVYIIGSILVDRFYGMSIFGWIFIIAVFIGLLSVFILLNIPEKKEKIKVIKPSTYFSRLKRPFVDKKYRALLYFGAAWSFALNFSSPFYIVIMLDDLELSFFVVAIFLIIDTLGKIWGLQLFRNLTDKFGAKPTLSFGITLCSFTPLLFIFVTKTNFFLIPIIFIFTSFTFGAIETAISQITLKAAPRRYNAYYIASFSSVAGLFSGIGPVLGGALAMYLKIMGMQFPLKIVLLISGVMRIMTLPLIARLYEPKSKDVKDMVTQMRNIRFVSFFVNIYSVANYTSKIVLVPQKQFFIIQRKASSRIRKDIKNTVEVLSKTANSLGNVTKKNIDYTRKRLKELDANLMKNISKLKYMEGSNFADIPQKALDNVIRIRNILDNNRVKEAKDLKSTIAKYADKLERELEEAKF